MKNNGAKIETVKKNLTIQDGNYNKKVSKDQFKINIRSI